MKRTTMFAVLSGLVLIGWLGLKWRSDATMTQVRMQLAEDALKAQRYPEARLYAETAVTWLTSQDQCERAWHVAGRAYLEDRELTRIRRMPDAMKFLTRIPRESAWYPPTALALANDKLFEGKQLRDALELIDNSLLDWPDDPGLHAWKIVWLTVTRRAALAEPHFLAAAQNRSGDSSEVVRVWLLSQFAPEQLELEFDRRLGTAGNAETTTDAIRLERWTTLMRWNLGDPVQFAAIAEWYLERGFLQDALGQLAMGRSAAELYPEPYYLSVSIRAFCDAQQWEAAESLLPVLEELAPGFLSHKAVAQVALAREQNARAIQALEAARTHLPGRIDPWVSTALEQLYGKAAGEENARKSAELRREREQIAAQRPRLLQILTNGRASSDNAWLLEFLGQLNRELEIDMLKISR